MTELVEPQLMEALDQAHIIYPNVNVGEKALTLCGLEWKLTTPWSEIPSDYPICRGCVDVTIGMLTESMETHQRTVAFTLDLTDNVKTFANLLVPDNSLVLGVLEEAAAYEDEQQEKRDKKRNKKRSKALDEEEKQEKKIEKAFKKALKDNQGDRLPEVPDSFYRDAVEVRMLRAQGLPWVDVAAVLDMPVDECKGVCMIAFGEVPKKG